MNSLNYATILHKEKQNQIHQRPNWGHNTHTIAQLILNNLINSNIFDFRVQPMCLHLNTSRYIFVGVHCECVFFSGHRQNVCNWLESFNGSGFVACICNWLSALFFMCLFSRSLSILVTETGNSTGLVSVWWEVPPLLTSINVSDGRFVRVCKWTKDWVMDERASKRLKQWKQIMCTDTWYEISRLGQSNATWFNASAECDKTVFVLYCFRSFFLFSCFFFRKSTAHILFSEAHSKQLCSWILQLLVHLSFALNHFLMLILLLFVLKRNFYAYYFIL